MKAPAPASPRALALMLAVGAMAPVANAQTSITLFGQAYSVQRFDYHQQVFWPSLAFPGGPPVRLFESEGVYYAGDNKLYMSADDISDIFIGDPDNTFIEVNVLTDGSNNVTGLSYSRTLANVDILVALYDPNPGGLTVNTSATGLGAGGNLVVIGNEGYIYAYGLQPPQAGQLLEYPVGSGCGAVPGGCNIDISLNNFNAEDICFVPAAGSRGPQFFIINQDLGGTNVAGVERWSTTGQPLGSFQVGAGADSSLAFAVAKGLTYVPDSPKLPAAIRRPGGVVLVSFDRDFPALQAFDSSGNFIATEKLTTNGLAGGPRRLDISGSTAPLHLESLAVDPVTGRIFLVNQGVLSNGNWMWVLTPVPSNCTLADITEVGGTEEFPGSPDGQLTVDDLILFVNLFSAGTNCPGAAPCNRADVTGIGGGGSEPDGELTVDDLIEFVNAFSTGC